MDGESAFELLEQRAAEAAAKAEAEETMAEEAPAGRRYTSARRYEAGEPPKRRSRGNSDSIGELLVKSAIRTASTRSGRKFLRGVLGGLFKGR